MASGPIIRRMTPEDVDAVYAIETDTFKPPWSRESFVHEMTANVCARYLVAVLAERVVGFAGMWVVLDEAHITNIAVAKAFRMKGYGSQLIKALVQYAANLGASHMTLEVRSGNQHAQCLYQSLGFQAAGRRKRYYEDNGEDAVLMVNDSLPEPERSFREPETLEEG